MIFSQSKYIRFRNFCMILCFLFLAYPAYGIKVTEVITQKGIKAWLVEDKSVPIISLKFAFKTGGTAYDPVGKEGLAQTISAMLDEGAGNLNSQEFQLKLKKTTARLQFSATLDKFRGSLTTLSVNKRKSFHLLSLTINKPRFDSKPLRRIRSQLISNIKRNAQDPGTIASKTWYKAAFPKHPYGRSSDGKIASIKGINKQDLQNYMGRHITRNSLLVAAAGDITPKELSVYLDWIFGNLPLKGKSQKLADVIPNTMGQLIVVDYKIPQSIVVFGHAALKRDHPDWYIALVMNHILGGGGFSSRLMSEVREKRGLAYSVYSYLNPFDHSALYMGKVASGNKRVNQSIKIIREEWKKFVQNGAADSEIIAAKTYLNGSFPLRLTSTRGIASLLLAMQINNLGRHYLERREQLINDVSQQDIKRVAKNILSEEHLTFVVVGQPKGIKLVSGRQKENF